MDPENFIRGGPFLLTLTGFLKLFLVDEGVGGTKYNYKSAIINPASETPFKWRFAGGPMMAQR